MLNIASLEYVCTSKSTLCTEHVMLSVMYCILWRALNGGMNSGVRFLVLKAYDCVCGNLQVYMHKLITIVLLSAKKVPLLFTNHLE